MNPILECKSDKALILEYALNGSPEVMTALIERHWPEAFRLAFRILGDRAAAEDTAQEAFIAMIQNAKKFDSERGFAPWFRTIVLNAARKRIRSRAIRRKHESGAANMRPSLVEEIRERLEIQDVLGALPDQVRRPLELRFWNGYTLEEVGKALHCPRDTARSRIDRGLAQLRRSLVGAGCHIPPLRLTKLFEVSSAIGPCPAAPSALALQKAATLSLGLVLTKVATVILVASLGLAALYFSPLGKAAAPQQAQRPNSTGAKIEAELLSLPSKTEKARAGSKPLEAKPGQKTIRAAPPSSTSTNAAPALAKAAPELLFSITDAKGSPVAGAKVAVLRDWIAEAGRDPKDFPPSPPKWSKYGQLRVADEQGQLRVRSPKLKPGLRLYAWARSGFRQGRSAGFAVGKSQTTIAIQIQHGLRPNSSTGLLRGRIIAVGRTPGAPLTCKLQHTLNDPRKYSWDRLEDREALMDGQGRFELPHLSPGNYKVTFATANFAPIQLEFAIEAGHATEHDLRFEIQASRLEGRVLLPAGAKIKALTLSLSAQNQDYKPQTISPDGRFHFAPLPLGDTVLEIELPGHAIRKSQYRIKAPGVHDAGDIDLTKGARLSGRLVARDGQPLGNEPLIIVAADSFRKVLEDKFIMVNSTDHSLRTDSQGRFQLSSALPGVYHLRVRKDGNIDQHLFSLESKILHQVELAQVDLDVGDLVVNRQASVSKLSGRIVGPDGRGVPALVRARGLSGFGFGRHLSCDSEGRFTIDRLAPGPIFLTATYKNLTTRRPIRHAVTVQNPDLKITLILGAEVYGQVLAPVARRAKLRLEFSPDGDHSAFGTSRKFADTDTYRISGLAPGAYFIEIPGAASRRRILLRSGAPLRLDFDLSKAKATVHLHLQDLPKTYGAKGSIRWRSGLEAPEFLSTGAFDGDALVLRGLAPGPAILDFQIGWTEYEKKGNSTYYRGKTLRFSRDILVRDGDRHELSWPRGQLAHIEGILGQGIRAEKVWAIAPGVAASATVADDGRFKLIVPEGSYTIGLGESPGASAPVCSVTAGSRKTLSRPLSGDQ